ncbi:MAG: tRNA (adenosine(37)-N6)-threonylcarbamoyltransferase complex ATPase subunit type 1 TsaE [Atopobiaceae bacterium]|jgi:tRNA threonylcarbamoyladenosine biosynthesis protein TsaE|nr:tRNA (adenosine(37)-N6)-threonylcarbamoyltransferase complex ATPase subunit type 1 TsaE [Atopobiaceae bacterium]MCI2174103.1 tRNA (adenosine(37)-N6)-threonylcarbamoyltransferase complex ATPase subunit type 1 TsaE [Atopobiaceae bacterium]MCI2206744.1 tRNA (adenosine(37)-N6)-threonylcarbamoyltransferase complex ATPase subunit type 1 TsaE [Atopobiaceae bacterium]
MTGGLLRTAPGEYVSHATKDTIELGERLGSFLAPGDVLVLTGDLGAGKTQLTKGIARALGVSGQVTSPTFNIMVVHEGDRMPLYHLDLYRLDDASQLGDAGLYDVLGSDGPCVIEWGEQFADEIGDDRLDVFLTRLDDEVAPGEEPPRSIRFEPHGPRAESIVGALA